MNVANSIALASTEQLLEELMRRHALVACRGSVLMDGRQVTKSRSEGITERQLTAHLEVRALEVMSRGMATAAPKDRVHRFTQLPAMGDYAPGSLSATVEMLAIQTGLK